MAREELVSDEFFGKIRDLIRNVRHAGSFKRWAMQSHYEILTLRGLANKKYVTSTDPKLNSLVALPNEVLCHVLGYWKETLPRLYDLNPAGRARLQN
jgi:hypothetical protein